MQKSLAPNIANTGNRLRDLASESVRRRDEALRLYRPLPKTEPFHNSPAMERVLRGGNQSGKTKAAAAEFASAATGIHLFDSNGDPIPFRYPRNRKLILWVIGYDQTHIGQTIYPALFEEGAFDIISDLKTGEMRAWDPRIPGDLERKDDAKPAPPLIPQRLIKQFAWETKANRVFSLCELTNGNIIRAFSSKGEAGQGVVVDLIWIDEDIEYPKHVSEWRVRLSRRSGKLMWSAWPHNANEALVYMHRRAEVEKWKLNPEVQEYILRYSENPYIPEETRLKILAGYTADERRSRDDGEFLFSKMLVFPSFSIDVHGIPGPNCPQAMLDDLKRSNFRPSNQWTHYMVADPGHAQPAILLAAIPPPGMGDHVVVYGELYDSSIDLDPLVSKIAQRVGGTRFEAFMIDGHAGRQTPMCGGLTIQEQWTDAFIRYGLKSRLTGHGFIRGSDDITGRNTIVRSWLGVRQQTGTPKFLCVKDTTPSLQHEFISYKKRIQRDYTVDDVISKNDHLMDCLGYLASYSPKYHNDIEDVTHKSPVELLLDKWRSQDDRKPEGTFLGAGALY